MDCAYHYYLDGDSIVEGRNGSDQVLKQQVWGQRYIDELVQVSINSDPTADNTCETAYWVCQDANYNVIGLVDSAGALAERYEYTPYGERTVFFSPGANDPDVMAPTLMSRRIPFVGGVNQPYGLNEFGHQGLHHDEELGLIYNRARQLHPTLGRFMQRDPLGYVDGMGLYEYVRSGPIDGLGPTGLALDSPTNAFLQALATGNWSQALTIMTSVGARTAPAWTHAFYRAVADRGTFSVQPALQNANRAWHIVRPDHLWCRLVPLSNNVPANASQNFGRIQGVVQQAWSQGQSSVSPQGSVLKDAIINGQTVRVIARVPLDERGVAEIVDAWVMR